MIALLIIEILVGAFGLFINFAGAMSDAPEEGEQYGRAGLIIMGISIVSLVVTIYLHLVGRL